MVAGNFKTKIGGHLTAIRNIVHEADLSEAKRDAIFRRGSKLQFEVDRDRTRSEAAMGLMARHIERYRARRAKCLTRRSSD